MAAEQLLVTEGEQRGALLSVDAELILGRLAPQNEGRLGGDPEISRRHARVSRGSNGELTIEDVGSANGTFVNGDRITGPRTLQVGDVVKVGRTALKVTASPVNVPENTIAEAPATEIEIPSTSPGVGGVFVVTSGTRSGLRLTVRDELIIGRTASGEGRFADDLGLSRRHARIARDSGGRLTVEDLGSANGTFVNGERLDARRVLKIGDSVRVGETMLQLTGTEEPAGRAREQPPAKRPAPPPAVEPMIPALPPGSVFARCRIEAVISHGDMGIVYRADELALQRLVALKLILPEYSSDERFRERFRRESRITAAIDHPNVIPVFDAGEEDDVLYIMMRLVDGTDLRTLIAAAGALEPLRAARIVQQVGAALDAAHARGMLHRDVKPSNVLLARRDHVYLTDFGLAKRADSAEALTQHGTIVARAIYVAPEQIMNDRVDARADVYALGCVLFEALTGEPPFARWSQGPDALAHVDAPRPSPLDLRPELPTDFEDVLRRAMATDPGDRYPSAGDLGRAALVAAGGLRRAGAWSMVATGEAAPIAGEPVARTPSDGTQDRLGEGTVAARPDAVRWAIALAGLLVVAAAMIAALIGISNLG
jgi:pSer/pThr/pTyr-binding forkhead associated (FHA) protein/tRNA A-37 threonylcarbamoyl transferase component Bud32